MLTETKGLRYPGLGAVVWVRIGFGCPGRSHHTCRGKSRLGIPKTSVDNDGEYNVGVELQHSETFINYRIAISADAFVPKMPPPAGRCEVFRYQITPHILPLYGISFDPKGPTGSAALAPVHYPRWPHRTPGTLYVVRAARVLRNLDLCTL